MCPLSRGNSSKYSARDLTSQQKNCQNPLRRVVLSVSAPTECSLQSADCSSQGCCSAARTECRLACTTCMYYGLRLSSKRDTNSVITYIIVFIVTALWHVGRVAFVCGGGETRKIRDRVRVTCEDTYRVVRIMWMLNKRGGAAAVGFTLAAASREMRTAHRSSRPLGPGPVRSRQTNKPKEPPGGTEYSIPTSGTSIGRQCYDTSSSTDTAYTH